MRGSRIDLPEVTTIILTYNHAGSIEAAIESALDQDYAGRHKVLVADDLSDDGTSELVASRASQDSRVVHLVPSRRLGMSANFANAVEHVTSPIVALCEGDDRWCDPAKLSRVVTELMANPSLSACGHMTRVVDDAGSQLRSIPTRVPSRPATFGDCILGPPCHTSSMVWRKAAFPSVPPWMIGLPLYDYPMAVMLSLVGPIAVLPDIMSEYRLHPAATWSTRPGADRKKRAAEVALVTSKHLPAAFRRHMRRASSVHSITAAAYLRRYDSWPSALGYLGNSALKNPTVIRTLAAKIGRSTTIGDDEIISDE